MKKPVVHVTDHAILRYLERVYLVDIEGLRRRIGRQIDRNMHDALPFPSAVVINGARFKMKGKAVTTCFPVKPSGRRRSHRGKRSTP